MYYRAKHAETFNFSKKAVALAVSLVLLLAVAVGATLALLMDKTDPIDNTFTPVQITIVPNEVVEGNVKKNITFTNTKTDKAADCYVRATVAIYWTETVDGVTNVVAQPAGGSVSELVLNNTDWFMVDDIYYYAKVLKVGETTSVMLNDITVVVPQGSAASCHVDIHYEAIQATPADAVTAAWPAVSVGNDGTLAKK